VTHGRTRSALLLVLICAAGITGGADVSAGGQTKRGPMPAQPPLEPDGTLSPGAKPRKFLKTPGAQLKLSNETTITRSTTAFRRSEIKKLPRDSAGTIGKLQFRGSSRSSEIYGLLRGLVDRKGRAWMQIRVPGRPNGRVGWVRSGTLNDSILVRTLLVVNRKTTRATFYRNGRKLFKAPVGVGKPSTPTPGGTYFIDRKEGAIFGPAYGPHILFTNAFSVLADWPGGGAVGIHGTDAPSLVPGRPSHGCIRMHNADITRLAKILPVGTPLLIR
jgi:L,D-transpeptidase catalytic domain